MKKAMILAAGRGERMRPLTDFTPKPLIRAGAKPLIQYHIEALTSAGFTQIIINHAYLGEQIENYLGDGQQFGINIHYSPESTALGTGGGILNALPFFDSQPFLVVNADVWCDINFATLNLPQNSLAHLILVANPDHNLKGDFYLQDHYVRNEGTKPSLTFSGIGIYHPALFATSKPGNFALTPLLRAACENDQVSGQYYTGRWLDIGTPERLNELEQILSTTR